MKPKLYTKSSDKHFIEKNVSCISSVDCSSYFPGHLGKPQLEQKKIVGDFQESVCNMLKSKVPDFSWVLEYSPNTKQRDAIDIFGSNSSTNIIIELDKHRADQVAKKFVSRNALFINNSLFYISLCYPGTSNMNSSECVKYFEYCKILSKQMGNDYAAFIVE